MPKGEVEHIAQIVPKFTWNGCKIYKYNKKRHTANDMLLKGIKNEKTKLLLAANLRCVACRNERCEHELLPFGGKKENANVLAAI